MSQQKVFKLINEEQFLIADNLQKSFQIVEIPLSSSLAQDYIILIAVVLFISVWFFFCVSFVGWYWWSCIICEGKELVFCLHVWFASVTKSVS